MIAYLHGYIKFISNDYCILEVNGVGYKVFTDTHSLHSLTQGLDAEFFIHTAVRDDAILLFGFLHRDTFDLFELLLTVSGIGAKGALAIVSHLSPSVFAEAISRQDLKILTKLPGVGKKSAERMILELKDKIQSLDTVALPPAQILSNAQDEAAEALKTLGYSTAEINSVFSKAPLESSTEQLIKFALKELNRFG